MNPYNKICPKNNINREKYETLINKTKNRIKRELKENKSFNIDKTIIEEMHKIIFDIIWEEAKFIGRKQGYNKGYNDGYKTGLDAGYRNTEEAKDREWIKLVTTDYNY